ncbi:bifunctional folylpolyglutamate synthase/dihydrofolate synthase [Lactiplantibacillus daowaiensis]|uniref:tetrahydrofolate synthase n=1 Tax=Lactiplantibacillus daowaiensis TaxID=2559918 RepID=A0ABW1RZT2_9LACO|nr:cyanophycin synthetase [Lactiplantibacillus daowaiensis]
MDTITARYTQLLAQLNQAMLVTEANRVPLLRRIMRHLNQPDRHFHVIHIAGTNGKGSTGAMLAAVLQAQGYHVGRFSSPAINDAREQLQVDGRWIKPAEFIDTYQEIVPVLTNMGLQAADVSVFEWFFLIGMVWFRNVGADWAIVEAGLGGQYDATNALAGPQVTVFTKIALDHTRILGSTIEAIAHNKAKIIKPKTTVVTLADQAPAARAVLQAEAANQGVALVTPAALKTQVVHRDITGTTVNIHSQLYDWSQLTLGLVGDYQLQNLSLALAVIAVLQRQLVTISETAVKTGLAHVRVPGRFTILQRSPLMIADGAHNPDGMQALVHSVQTLLPQRPIVWVVGVLRDKAYEQMLQQLVPAAQVVITNTPANPERALSAEALAAEAKTMTTAGQPRVLAAPDIQAAITLAKTQVAANGAIAIAGSFYVMRELQQAGWPVFAHD